MQALMKTAGCNSFTWCNSFSWLCNIFFVWIMQNYNILLARPATQQFSSAYALRWINYCNLTVVTNRSNVLILRYHNIKTPIRFASKRFATISHDWNLSRDIFWIWLIFESWDWFSRHLKIWTWDSKNLNSANRKLEDVVGKVRNKLGKILRNENFPTSSGNFPTYWFYQLQFATTCKTEIQFYPTLCRKHKVGTSKFLDTWILNFPFPFT